MSWFVKIIPARECVLKIRWKKWFLFFSFMLLITITASVLFKLFFPAEYNNALKFLFLSLSAGGAIFFISLAIRIYYYGLCLSAHEAYERESAIVKNEWTAWASKSFFVSAYKLFPPAGVSLSDLATSKSVEIYNEQKLELRGHNGESYTEAQLIYELLASVRATIINLLDTCMFDVMFTYGCNDITFATFKECWVAIGLSEKYLKNNYYLNGTLEQEFDRLSNPGRDTVTIVIAANIENIEKYSSDVSDFASIQLFTDRKERVGCTNNGVAMRAMGCEKSMVRQEFIHMMIYQPEVLQTSKVYFCNMDIDEVLELSDVLRTSYSSLDSSWTYESLHLNLVFGNLGSEHFWLTFPFSLFVAEKVGVSVLMISSVGNEYIFNVIKPCDNSREH